MGPSITNNGRPAVLSTLVTPGGVGQGTATPGLTYEEEAASQSAEDGVQNDVVKAFADIAVIPHTRQQMPGLLAHSDRSVLTTTLFDLCDKMQWSDSVGEHINFSGQMPKQWFENGAITKKTVTTAKSAGWNALRLDGSHFITPPSAILADVLSPREYSSLSDAGVVSPAFAHGGRGSSNLDVLEMELFYIAPSIEQNIFYPDHYSFRSLDEAFDDGYLLVHVNDSNFLIQEESLSEESRWTLLRLKTAGVVRVRGKAGLEGDDKVIAAKKGQVIAMDDFARMPSGGELDIAEFQFRQWERWPADPQPVVDLSKNEWLAQYVDLRNWLGSHVRYIEPGDIERLSFLMTAAKKSETLDALDSIVNNIKGIVAEIAARPRVHAEYLELQMIHKNAIMLVAPQVHDGDIFEASDAVVGEITDDGKIKIYSVWEITSAKDGAEANRIQLDDTIRRRFVESGIHLRDEHRRGKNLEVILDKGVVKNILVLSGSDIARAIISMREQMLTKFDEEYIVPRVADIRKTSRSKYSSATLIQRLQMLATRLGRVPTVSDLNETLDMPSETAYRKHFGGYNKALKAAGFEPNLAPYSKKELLDKLKAFAEKLGHTPTADEVKADRNMPSSTTYNNQFGSFNAALIAAGLEPNRVPYSKEELIDLIKAFAVRLGHTPTRDDVNGDKKMPSSGTYDGQFGSFNAALKAAGLEPNRDNYTLEELLAKLKAFAEKLGHTPTLTELAAATDMPTQPTYHGRFGSYNAALKAAGLVPNHVPYSKKKLPALLKAFAEKLGHTPTRKEVDAEPNMPSSRSYEKQFGGFQNALREVGLIK